MAAAIQQPKSEVPNSTRPTSDINTQILHSVRVAHRQVEISTASKRLGRAKTDVQICMEHVLDKRRMQYSWHMHSQSTANGDEGAELLDAKILKLGYACVRVSSVFHDPGTICYEI